MSFRLPNIKNSETEQLNTHNKEFDEQRKINRQQILNENRISTYESCKILNQKNEEKIDNIKKITIKLVNYIYNINTIISKNNITIDDKDYINMINDFYKYYFNTYAGIKINFDSSEYGGNGLKLAILLHKQIRYLYKILITHEQCMNLIYDLIDSINNYTQDICKTFSTMYEIMYIIINYYRDLEQFDSEYECAENCGISCIDIYKSILKI